MEKRTKIYALILLLALCLVVPAVNAVSYTMETPGDNHNFGEIQPNEEIIINKPPHSLGISFSGAQNTFAESLSRYASSSDGSYSFKVYTAFSTQQGIMVVESTMTYTVFSNPVPPVPSGAYISATVYNTGENNLYYDYNVICMPAEGYFFAPLSFYSYGGQLPQCYLTSEETSIQVRVWAGEDIPIYSCALSGSGGVPNFQYIQTVLSAPVFAGNVVNNQTVHEELQNLPNPVKPSGSSGGIVSGAWQPLAVKNNLTVINTPFSYIVDNYLHYFHFPEMATPETVKAELLNGTGNLTAPLYDSIDGLTSVFMILPNYVSGVLTGLISPISDTVMLVKEIVLSLSDYVYNAMSVLYVFIPFIYLFIPDVIWWGLTIYLSYLVFAWLLTLLFGYDVISVFYIDPFVSWVRNRRGGD